MRDLYVGVDGGTGDMEAVLVDPSGRVLGRGTGGPSNDPAVVGRMHPDVGGHIVDSVRHALGEAGADANDIQAISLNLSGDPSRLTRDHAREWLAPLGLPERTVVAIDQDGLSAWAAAGFPDPAIWVLLGTNCGSEGMLDGRKIVHPLARLDLDAHFGRPVGAAVIGSWALGLALHAALGGRPTELYQAYLDDLKLDGLEALVGWSRDHATADERASLFRVAIELANAGDSVARDLLVEAGSTIANATHALARYMHVGKDGHHVTLVLAGKAWRAGGVLRSTFESWIHTVLPDAIIRENEVSQAEGAGLLAMRHAGLHLGPEIFSRL